MSKKAKPRSETSNARPYLSREEERKREPAGSKCLRPPDVEPPDEAKWDEAQYDTARWP